MTPSFNPFREWLGIDGGIADPNYYQLLSLSEYEPDVQRIRLAADRALTRVRSQRPGPQARPWAELLDLLKQAKEELIDSTRKAAYDEILRREPEMAGAVRRAARERGTTPPISADQPPLDLLAPALSAAVPEAGEPFAFPLAGDIDPMAPWTGGTVPPATAVPPVPITNVSASPPDPVAAMSEARTAPATTPAFRQGRRPKAAALAIRPRGAAGRLALFFSGLCVGVAGTLGVLSIWNPQLLPWSLPPAVVADAEGTPDPDSALPRNERPVEGAEPAEQPDREAPTEPASQDVAVEPEAAAPPTDAAGAEPDPAQPDPQVPATSMPEPLPAEPAPSNPAPDAPPPPTPEEVANLGETLRTARAALSRQNFEEAETALVKADGLARLPEHQALVSRLRMLGHYQRQFRAAVERGMQQLAAGASLEISENVTVGIVERKPDAITVRVEGRNQRYSLNELPLRLGLALAGKGLESDSAALVVQGAFQALHPRSTAGHLDEVRAWWEQAAAAGEPVADLLPVLNDDYSRLTEVKPD